MEKNFTNCNRDCQECNKDIRHRCPLYETLPREYKDYVDEEEFFNEW